MSEHEKWFKDLNENGKSVYFLGNEHKVSKMAWDFQQVIIDDLKAQLNNMEQCYIGMKKERDDLQERVNSTLGVCTENRLCIGKFMIEDETLELISDVEKALRGEP